MHRTVGRLSEAGSVVWPTPSAVFIGRSLSLPTCQHVMGTCPQIPLFSDLFLMPTHGAAPTTAGVSMPGHLAPVPRLHGHSPDGVTSTPPRRQTRRALPRIFSSHSVGLLMTPFLHDPLSCPGFLVPSVSHVSSLISPVMHPQTPWGGSPSPPFLKPREAEASIPDLSLLTLSSPQDRIQRCGLPAAGNPRVPNCHLWPGHFH